MVNSSWGDWGDKGPHTMMEDEHTLTTLVKEKYPGREKASRGSMAWSAWT